MKDKYSSTPCPAVIIFKYAIVLIPPDTAKLKPIVKTNNLKIIKLTLFTTEICFTHLPHPGLSIFIIYMRKVGEEVLKGVYL